MVEPVIEVRRTDAQVARALHADVVAGLTAREKWLPPKWFYDAVGSELFEQITQLPEYYVARAEREILAGRAHELAELTQAGALVELGSGYSTKTRLLLDAFGATGTLREFITLDVSESALREAAYSIAADYPGLRIHGIVADFTDSLDFTGADSPRVVALLGGTIGNLLPDERRKFLAATRGSLARGDYFLLGTDLVKSPAIIQPAYDDAAGVTARFNRNVLHVLNRELGADFRPEAFSHQAIWDAEHEWIEMRLRAEADLRVTLPAVQLVVDFAAGEELRTEISAKFHRQRVVDELSEAGFTAYHWWTDAQGYFGLTLAVAD